MIPNLTNKTKNEIVQLAEKTHALVLKRKYRFIDFIFPETGKYSRSAYPKVMDWYEKGKTHRFRMIGGGNGSGKSHNAATELVYHVTGDYPTWWTGLRQANPHNWWIVSESPGTFRDSLQKLLLGNTLNDDDLGTGLIPKEKIVGYSAWSGVSGTVNNIEVRHKNGHIVTISVKSTDQKRENLQAATIDGVVFDEEPPLDIYEECVMRLRGNPTKPPGISMLVFTSLKGLTDVVLKYCPDGIYPEGQHPTDPQKYITRLFVEQDCPHLTQEDINVYRQEFGGSELDSRLSGAIALGSGRIYPYAEDQVFVKPFPIPDYWPRCFTLDFGHHVTCAIWGAKDPHTNVLYIYSEYYSKGHQTSQVHSLNIQAKGKWIKGICDPSGGGRQDDGRQLVDLFRSHGLDLTPGDNSIIGLSRNCNMFENGTLKIFNTCEQTKREFRLYRFDSKRPNEPARNQDDHAMDCLQYMTSMFDYVASVEYDEDGQNDSWSRPRSGFDKLTGY